MTIGAQGGISAYINNNYNAAYSGGASSAYAANPVPKVPPVIKQADLPDADASKTASSVKSGRQFNDGFAKECQTCKNRKYQDGSNDASVSFKSPTKIAPEAAASAVRGHEAEHVSHEQANARKNDREIVYQSVQIHTGICPECGKVYISGGTTKTATRAKAQSSYEQMMNSQTENGTKLNAAV